MFFRALFSLCVLLFANFSQAWAKPHRFTVEQKEYLLSKSFSINSEESNHGKVEKSIFGVRTWYYLYNCAGEKQAYGICSLFCLGALYDWATEIYVYNDEGLLGWIDGQAGTTAAAKFSIYNRAGDRVGIAYLDANKTGFEIVDADTGNTRVASLKRHFVLDTVDHWEVIVYRSEIDPEILRIFAAFAVDRQNSWKEDK